MDNQHRQIKGYRELNEAEIALMNDIKAQGCGIGRDHRTPARDGRARPAMGEHRCDGLPDRPDGPRSHEGDCYAALQEMEKRKDGAYEERNRVVAALAWFAIWAGWRAGIARTAIEGWSEDWHGCVYIDFPNGQVSWHFHDSHASLFADLPPYRGSWDGHTTPEKYERVAYVCEVLAQQGKPTVPAHITAPTAEQALGDEGVFLGHAGLRGLAECDEFWEAQMYGTRLYYGSGGGQYLHRSVLRAAVAALDKPREVHVEGSAEPTIELHRAIARVLESGDRLDCGCTVRERDSGHRVGCNAPEMRESIEALRVEYWKAIDKPCPTCAPAVIGQGSES